jgi:hypothetical protein
MILVSNGRADSPTASARSILARGLLAHLSSSGGGAFVLSVDRYLGRRAEHHLTALACSLEPVALSSRVELRVETAGSPDASVDVTRALTA